MLDFDVDYFKEETRGGFTIPAFMKHAWASQLEILAKVDMICEENDIPYFANWGTLLGAVRHEGYIPWDDDIDLCMFRSDLERFCKVLDNYEGISIQNIYNSSDYGFHACRVYNSSLFMAKRRSYKDYHGFPFPVGLDIFNLDYVPRDKHLEEEQVEAVQVCATAAHTKEWLDKHIPSDKGYRGQFEEYKAAVKWLEDNCGMQFSREYPDYQEIVILHEEIAGLYGADDSDYVTEIQCLANGRSYYIPKDIYATTIRLPFENTTIPVPIGYNYILQTKYGDSYMTPRNVAAGHEYPFYNTFIRAIFDERKHKTFEGACEYIQNMSSRYYINFLSKSTKTALDINKDKYDEEAVGDIEITREDRMILLAECELLEEFKRLCNKVGITYYAIGDTLAVIESGQYEDVLSGNINVAIKRENIDKLMLMLKQELDPWFDYSCLYTSNEHEDMRIRIWSDSYMCNKDEFAERFHGCKEEVSLYVSIIDYVAPDKEQDEVRMTLVKNLIATSKTMPSVPPYSVDILGIVNEWNKILQFDINKEMNLKREFLNAADTLGGAVSKENATDVRITADLQEGRDSIYPRSYFEEKEDVPFYITKISVPKRK